ncbi:prolyl oligopeptidase family serine peptidase [Paenibacillus sp. TRM 82003]|uniref:alpha/beta hydrolase family protein n=1 Tax=Kineococcus sp. TRM81007 TaxID=2925831 RepID=UPI001F59453F|nr:prolyl oligopeptidase family serine peptidase [Kineococcus sp. TRM81007]MCI2237234.1 prolyl oligopeptidase family serine peptidase [Kineococcus sp. TRM81007]MCI3919416.1 prolyl oligopeptidase family serine peptidase [Paenibacillus sp. TRM 82003]
MRSTRASTVLIVLALALQGAALLSAPAASVLAATPIAPIAPSTPATPTTPLLQRQLHGPTAQEDLLHRSTETTIPTAAGALAATVLQPETGGAVPGVVLVAGSGAGSRASLAHVATAFARRGIAVLTYDKDLSVYTPFSRDYAALGRDAAAAAAVLRQRSGVDPARVGVWGISEGGWVVASAAAADPAIAFVVMASAPTVTPGQQLEHTLARFLHEHGLGALRRLVTPQLALGRHVFDYTTYTPPLAQVRQPVLAIFGAEDATVPINTAVATLVQKLPTAPAIAVLAGVGHDLTTSPAAAERAGSWMHNPDQKRSFDTAVSQGVPVVAMPDPSPTTAVLLHGANLSLLTGLGLTVVAASRCGLHRATHRLTAVRLSTVLRSASRKAT